MELHLSPNELSILLLVLNLYLERDSATPEFKTKCSDLYDKINAAHAEVS